MKQVSIFLFFLLLAGSSAKAQKISTIAGIGIYSGIDSGDGGPAIYAKLAGPGGIALDSKGNIYVSDAGGGVRKIDRYGIITTALTIGNGLGMMIDGGDNIYIYI